jgi:outer membrane protein TolC
MEELYKLTLENQPELAVFSYAIEKNKNEKALAKKSFFPDIAAQIGLRGITSGSIGPWDLMMAFTLPLWFWTKQRYEIKEAIANLDEAKAAYEAMKNNALSEVKDLATKVEVNKNKVNLYKNSSIPILEKTISSSLTDFSSGKSDLRALMDNARLLIEAKKSYYKALTDYNMSLSDLERAVGVQLE